MDRKAPIFLFSLLACSACIGQPFTFLDPAFICQTNVATPPATSWSLTNEPYGSGTNIISWWVGTNYYTNASIGTLPDIAGIHGYNLTNPPTTTNSFSIQGNGLYFRWTGSGNALKSTSYSSTQPHEVDLVVAYLMTSNFAGDPTFYDGLVSGHRNFLRHGLGTIGFGYYAGTVQSFMPDLTNQAIMFSSAYNGANSYVFTNKVLATTANPGTQNMDQGMVLGGGFSANYMEMLFYEMATYAATNSVLSRSNIYYYWKNVKGYPLP